MNYDFSGWATKNDIECSDGRVIKKDAFKQNDGQKVPLVWNHQHDDPNEVLGHALLENRDEGVYAYCKFNDTESGKTAKALVVNGDVDKLSIYANRLKTNLNDVVHGCIREVSLVLAGANPGAFIDSIISHSEDGEDEEEGVIYTDEQISLNIEDDSEGKGGEKEMKENVETENTSEETKSEEIKEEETKTEETKTEETVENEKSSDENQNEVDNDSKDNSEQETSSDEDDKEISHSDDKTIGEIFSTIKPEDQDLIYVIVGEIEKNGKVSTDKKVVNDLLNRLNEEQQQAFYALVGSVTENNNEREEKNNMKHNVFENDNEQNALAHSEFIASSIADAKKYGSMKDSFMAHAEAEGLDWGEANDYSYLFPDAKNIDKEPRMVENDDSWAGKVMSGVKHSPFSRVKNTLGKMDETTGRAKGYIKGTKKVNIQIALLNRVTTPTTVYIKNDIDRDDLIDITDIDVVAWQKKEMRKALNRELAQAILIGDGRDISDSNKINEQNIRPIVSDDDMYTIKYTVTDGRDYNNDNNSHSENDSLAKGIIRAALKARKNYKGSGNPTFFTTEDVLTDLLLIEDQNGRVIYDSIDKLATALRVKEIVTVTEMERLTDTYGIIVNLSDYTAGADKGGEINLFDDFDIDYNQMKYLMETRMSGALVQPYSAIVLKAEGNEVNPQG